MNEQIQDWTKRTQRYWYVDGLAEIGVGAILVVLGLFYAVLETLPANAAKSWLLGLGQPVLIIGFAVLVRWIVRRLKEKITFPRTGFIAYRPAEPRRKISGILIAIVTAVTLGLVVFISRSWVNLQWVPSITGLFAGLLTFMIAYRIKLPRFYFLTIYTLAVGFTASLLRLTDSLNNEVFLIGLGVGWIVSGLLTLVKYLRSTSPAEVESDVENG